MIRHFIWGSIFCACEHRLNSSDKNLIFQDPNDKAPEFEVAGTPYTLRVMDTMADRESTVKDFAARSIG